MHEVRKAHFEVANNCGSVDTRKLEFLEAPTAAPMKINVHNLTNYCIVFSNACLEQVASCIGQVHSPEARGFEYG